MAAMYAGVHGPDGLVRIARRTHRLAATLVAALRKRGVEVGGDFFDTLHVTGVAADAIPARAAEAGITLRRIHDPSAAYYLTEPPTLPSLTTLAPLFDANLDAIQPTDAT